MSIFFLAGEYFSLTSDSNAVVTLDYHWDEVQFKDEVKEHIVKHATTTRAEWRAVLLEE